MAAPRRSFVKAWSWAIIAFTFTTAVAWWITGEVEIALGFGIIDRIIKLILYYFHERAWAHIDWGRRNRDD